MAVQRELSTPEVERLFLGAIDGQLATDERAAFDELLERDVALRARYEAYRRTVSLLQGAPKEKAPDALASMILRRTRRRRFALRETDAVTTWRVPAEVVIPLLLAALVALFMILASP
jgi:anti-sigma factor RsiW